MITCLRRFNVGDRRVLYLKCRESRRFSKRALILLTPDQARIQGMKNQVKTTQKAIKAEKARQKIKAGQQQLAQID